MKNPLSLPPSDLATFLGWPSDYKSIISHKEFHSFLLPKRTGGKRLIHAPGKKLKFIQKSIADCLMPFYMNKLPQSVHGYIPGDYPGVGVRHILSNAEAHLGSGYLLNMDLENFFDTVTTLKVMGALRDLIPEIHQESLELAIHACSKDNALPMGAPSSPVLSNIVCLPLDMELEQVAAESNIVYTRYVDDMSFSGPKPLEGGLELDLANVIQAHGFKLNPKKRRHFVTEEPKLVTGLILNNGEVGVQQDILDNLTNCIAEYGRVKWLSSYMSILDPNLKYKARYMKQSINGQLAFLEQITGEDEMTVNFRRALETEVMRLKPSFDFYI